MTHFIRHEPCPICRKDGRDRSGNNLGVYSDGSVYCFSCGYTRNKRLVSITKEKPIDKIVILPEDVTTDLPSEAIDWLDKYNINLVDRIKHTILWSPSESRIIFPIFNPNDQLLAWQGRYVGTGNRIKWRSYGNLKDILHILSPKDSDTLILVEDIISAIRVSLNSVCSMPLFGSHVSTQTWLRLRQQGYKHTIVWLDKDKQLESIKFAKQGRDLGMDVRSVITEKDPKEYSNEEIKNILTK